MKSVLFVICVLCIVIGHARGDSKFFSQPSECGFIYLSVSSLVSSSAGHNPDVDDKLELNWDLTHCNGVKDDNTPDVVALFYKDPESNPDAAPVVVINVSDQIWNYHVTNVSLGHLTLPGEWTREARQLKKSPVDPAGRICLPVWIASFKDNTLLRKNCLQLNPTWMADIRNQIAHIPLKRLLIPGTHNAGSFAYSDKKRVNLDRFVLCQDRDIWTQLVSGIRYFDMRLAFYPTLRNIFQPNKNQYTQFWVNHNLIKVRPLWPVLKDIRRFMDSTTDEIVIFDIHHLPVGFYISNNPVVDRHLSLMKLLKEEFSDHILDYGAMVSGPTPIAEMTVSDILKTGRRLIVTYPDKGVLGGTNDWIWPMVKHQWGNTNDPYILKDYLNRVMDNPYTPSNPRAMPLWSAMAQTTPQVIDYFNPNLSLRKNSDIINRNLTMWVNHEWPSKANIISSDFYMGNNLIELMVHHNRQRGRNLKMAIMQALLKF